MNAKFASFIRNPWVISSTVGVTAFCSGLGLGYVLGKREKLVPETRNRITEQLVINFPEFTEEDEVSFEESIYIDRERPDPSEIVVDEMVKAHIEHIVNQGLTPTHADYVEGMEFAKNNSDWDYDEEIAKRTPNKPYVIHKDEFWAEERGYEQITLCYYAGDDILADEDDTPIYDYKKIIGTELLFGHGSTDPRVFHVRNEKNEAEYEILLHDGRFSEEVLGIEYDADPNEDHLKHSLRKFKWD